MTTLSQRFPSRAFVPEKIQFDPELRFQDARLKQALAYWIGKQVGREMPGRRDLRPAEMTAFLPDVLLFDVLADDDGTRQYRFRLMGTRVAEHYGEHTGELVDDDPNEIARQRWRVVLDQACETRGAVRAVSRAADPYKQWLLAEGLLAPLGDDDGAVAMVFCVMMFRPETELSDSERRR